jgi:hypothetical protein
MRRQTTEQTLPVRLQRPQPSIRDAVLLPYVLLAVVGGAASALVVHPAHDLVLGFVSEGHVLDVGLRTQSYFKR